MPNEYYDAPYLSEQEHTLLDHADLPGVPQSGATVRSFLHLNTTMSTPGASFDAAFDAPTDPVPSGTGASWDVGAPTIVTIDETDSYNISFSIFASGADSTGTAYVILNDDDVGPLYYWIARIYVTAVATGPSASVSIPAVPLVAGDTLKLHCDFSVAPTSVQAGLVVAR